MLRNRITLNMLLATVCGVGVMSSSAQAFVLTEVLEADGSNRGSARDLDLNLVGDSLLLAGSVGPASGAFSTYTLNSAFIFEVPNVVDPFTDITAASIGGSLFQNATAVGFNIDMVLMSYTAANPGVVPADFENGINQAVSATDVLIDDWAVPGTLAGVPLASVDMLSFIQNNYVPGGGFLKIGMTMDQFPAAGVQPTGRYRMLGTGTDAVALTVTYENGVAPPTPILANYEFDTNLAIPETGITGFVSTDDSFTSTATNIESNLFVLDSALGVPAPSLFHGDPKWIVDSESDALSQGAYIGFEITPDSPGESLDLDELSFDLQQDVAGEGLGEWAIYGDLDPSDGLDDFVKLFDGINVAAGSSSDPLSYESISIDLSGFQFQGLDGAALRLYRWHDGAFPINATPNSRTDNLVLRGNVVPEPASLMLVGLGCLAFLKRNDV